MSENPESLRIAGAAYFDEFTKTHDLLSALEAQARRIANLEATIQQLINGIEPVVIEMEAKITDDTIIVGGRVLIELARAALEKKDEIRTHAAG